MIPGVKPARGRPAHPDTPLPHFLSAITLGAEKELGPILCSLTLKETEV